MSQYSIPISRPAVLQEPIRQQVRHPLTPPDTDFDYGNPLASAPAGLGLGVEYEQTGIPHSVRSGAETAIPLHHRKGPSVSYINSDVRESRERVIQRSVKWLLMVTPPASFAHEHGYLGNTLSSGPSHRLTQGILMPLYPTLGGQLGAIAREFSLPSIAGLCLYLHTTTAGVAITPRISDESWSLLWSPFLDTRNPTTPQSHLPLCGRVEFDIDITKARWYDAWLAAPHRDTQDFPVSVLPSRPPTLSHWRGDSRTEDPGDDLETVSLMRHPRTRMASRHVPKKLSLVDRFEQASVKSGSKLLPRHRSSSGHTSPRQHSLSPIAQQDEPRTARKDLDQLITTWRESASRMASPLAATGQTSLHPANLPNTFPLSDMALDVETQSELNLDDFAWSVSSVGPPEYDDDLDSLADWEYDPSVHLAQRLQGSVCLTPTTCTSFGPPDYDNFSTISYASRLPSPDIGQRMLDDCPPTPSTCTSWGAPSYPNSPFPYEQRAPSVYLEDRGAYSRPVTPSTATTWGAMDSYPASPVSLAYSEAMRTPDAGERSFAAAIQAQDNHYDHWTLVWPYYHVREVELPERWAHVWPYNQSVVQEHAATAQTYGDYPYLTIYPAVYPTFDLYPAPAAVSDVHHDVPSLRLGTGYPSFNLYPAVYPHLEIYPAVALGVAQKTVTEALPVQAGTISIPCVLSPAYPTFDIYPAVYPWNLANIYPAVATASDLVSLSPGYPAICIYAPVYPYNLENIYPSKIASVWLLRSQEDYPRPLAVCVKLESHYPVIDLYPPTYPHNLTAIYPEKHSQEAPTFPKSSTPRLAAQYPAFTLYPSVYPHNLADIYPRITVAVPSESDNHSRVINVTVSKSYPNLDIYAPVYPWNLEAIYPATYSGLQSKKVSRATISVRLETWYPLFNLYPAVYPASLEEIYPRAPRTSFTETKGDSRNSISVTLIAPYPAFDLYPAVYPHNLLDIYPAKHSSIHIRSRPKRSNSVAQPRALRSHHHKHSSQVVPPVPPLPENVRRVKPITPRTGLKEVKLAVVDAFVRYPTICPYPAAYPHFDLYPALGEHCISSSPKRTATAVLNGSRYPYLQIYAPVYPHFELYPGYSASVSETNRVIKKKLRKHTHADLHIQVFGRTPPTSPRQLPTPPTQVSPRLTRRRSGTITMNKQMSPDQSPSRRQLPTPPGVVSPMTLSPTPSVTRTPPRSYGPQGSSPTRIPSLSPRLSGFSSPLPPVSETGSPVTGSPINRSASVRAWSVRHVPTQLDTNASTHRSRGSLSGVVAVNGPASPQQTGAGLSRTMSMPPRPLPRARSGSVAFTATTPPGYVRSPLPPVPTSPPAAVPSYN
ncbi:hypothetical protein BXZ70DRAFT_396925 [Cristinia sonorae]|uniref:Uncharacterized protein n=1 Tax=Cristinia sonorae TaxID=1940300 RepID=A0A8K0UVL8_9AGAR|nr:hypothetical protein BXZ70DRAFT_396925 [Cristinia sonorae]